MTETLEGIQARLNEIKNILIDMLGNMKVTPQQVEVMSGLSEISERLGLITAGEFRAGNNKIPGLGFSGMRMGYPPFNYGGNLWHLVGINNDEVQVGINAETGQLMAAGGKLTIDTDAVSLEGLFYSILHQATYTNTRQGWLGMLPPSYPQAVAGPSYGMIYSQPEDDPSEKLTNEGFETGDLTGWTASGETTVTSSTKRSGSYSAYILRNGAGETTLTSDKFTVDKYHNYLLSFYFSCSRVWPIVTMIIKYYDATPTLLSTQYLWSFNSPTGWKKAEATVHPPDDATQAELVISATSGVYGCMLYIDDCSVYPTQVSRSAMFEPNFTIRGGPLELENLSVAQEPPEDESNQAISIFGHNPSWKTGWKYTTDLLGMTRQFNRQGFAVSAMKDGNGIVEVGCENITTNWDSVTKTLASDGLWQKMVVPNSGTTRAGFNLDDVARFSLDPYMSCVFKTTDETDLEDTFFRFGITSANPNTQIYPFAGESYALWKWDWISGEAIWMVELYMDGSTRKTINTGITVLPDTIYKLMLSLKYPYVYGSINGVMFDEYLAATWTSTDLKVWFAMYRSDSTKHDIYFKGLYYEQN